MDVESALMVVRPLADGVDPFTGEALPESNLYQRPQVLRALALAVTAMEHEDVRQKRRSQLPPKAGLPWTDEDDDRLAQAFDDGHDIEQLAEALERTRAAVQARLMKLGKISSESGFRGRPV